MLQARAIAQTFEASGAPTTRGKLFKADRRRAIDRYIDYFGGCPRPACLLRMIRAVKASSRLHQPTGTPGA